MYPHWMPLELPFGTWYDFFIAVVSLTPPPQLLSPCINSKATRTCRRMKKMKTKKYELRGMSERSSKRNCLYKDNNRNPNRWSTIVVCTGIKTQNTYNKNNNEEKEREEEERTTTQSEREKEAQRTRFSILLFLPQRSNLSFAFALANTSSSSSYSAGASCCFSHSAFLLRYTWLQ